MTDKVSIELSVNAISEIVLHALQEDARVLVGCIRDEFKNISRDLQNYQLQNLQDNYRDLEAVNRIIVYYGGTPVDVTAR